METDTHYNFDDSSISSAIFAITHALQGAQGIAETMLLEQLRRLLKRQREMYGIAN